MLSFRSMETPRLGTIDDLLLAWDGDESAERYASGHG